MRRSLSHRLHRAERLLSFIEGGFTAIIAIAAIYFGLVLLGFGTLG